MKSLDFYILFCYTSTKGSEMELKVGFKCPKCNDIIYKGKCFCEDLEVINKNDTYVLLTDNPNIDIYTMYIDNTGRTIRVTNNLFSSLGRDVILPENFLKD